MDQALLAATRPEITIYAAQRPMYPSARQSDAPMGWSAIRISRLDDPATAAMSPRAMRRLLRPPRLLVGLLLVEFMRTCSEAAASQICDGAFSRWLHRRRHCVLWADTVCRGHTAP